MLRPQSWAPFPLWPLHIFVTVQSLGNILWKIKFPQVPIRGGSGKSNSQFISSKSNDKMSVLRDPSMWQFSRTPRSCSNLLVFLSFASVPVVACFVRLLSVLLSRFPCQGAPCPCVPLYIPDSRSLYARPHQPSICYVMHMLVSKT